MKIYSYQRWSSDAQTLGDSEQRQLNKALTFCKNKGWTLSDKSFKDSGVSAKAGLNRAKGSQFAELLNFVRTGDKILVEDYDRFSREDPITSLNCLRSILKDKDIAIVFLSENVEVNQNNFLDDGVILPLFLKGFLGHKENTKKQERVIAAWKTKFNNIRQGKVERIKLPSWLEYQNGKYVVVESAAKVIRRMFQLCNEGKGTGEIATIFNKENVKPITKLKKHNGWNQGTVIYTLKSKKVIGINDSIEPNVSNVFPPIIDDKTFYTAQAKIKERNHFKGIKTTDDNMFSCLCLCSVCNSTMYKFTNQPNYVYLRCSAHKLGLDGRQGEVDKNSLKGKHASTPFNWFEISFIDTIIREQRFIRELVGGKEQPNNIKELEGKLVVLDNKVLAMTKDYEQSPSSIVAQLISNSEEQRKVLAAELEQELIKVNSMSPHNENIDMLMIHLSRKLGDFDTRIKIRELIRNVVEKVIVNSETGYYYIHFKGSDKPLEVLLHKGGGWTVNGHTYIQYTDLKTGKEVNVKFV